MKLNFMNFRVEGVFLLITRGRECAANKEQRRFSDSSSTKSLKCPNCPSVLIQ